MKHEDNISQIKSEHDSIDALLPWYVNGTLAAEESIQVEKHMASCEQCRVAINEFQSLQFVVQQNTVQQDTALALTEGRNLQDVLSRIDASIESRTDRLPVTPVKRQRESLASKMRGFLDIFMALPGGWRYTVVTQFLLLVLVLLGVVFKPAMEPAFTTLSSPEQNMKHNSVRMRVVFAEDVLFRDIRHLLVNARARIVDGPTPSGVYTLETVYAPDEVLQDVLNRWRDKALIRFVEPVSNVAARD